MNVHVLQHVSFEGLGAIADILDQMNADTHIIHLYEDPTLPSINDIDWLIVMGGPMSVNDTAVYPWLMPEIDLIKQCIDAKKPVLGICLGAQLIAGALGAKVYAQSQKEIGWLPIKAIEPNTLGFPEQLTVMHWHGETFDLPQHAERIAWSEACYVQAFTYQKHVVGLQFHIEMQPKSIDLMLENCAHELTQQGRYIQSVAQIRAGVLQYAPQNIAVLRHIMFGLKQSVCSP